MSQEEITNELRNRIINERLSIQYGDFDEEMKVYCDEQTKNKVLNEYYRGQYQETTNE